MLSNNKKILRLSINEPSFRADRAVVEKQYYETLKKKINWKNPKTYNEKLQIIKLTDDYEDLWPYVDKLAVRNYIKRTIGKKYLIPLIAKYNKVDEINFSKLPNKFIIKTTHGSGWNIVCHDKRKLNYLEVIKKLDQWLKLNYCDDFGKEKQYRKIIPRIICEKSLFHQDKAPMDYKFLCFNGEPKFIQLDIDRFEKHKQKFYTIDWSPLPFTTRYKISDQTFKKPKNLREMIKIAKILSRPFRHVRVDLYNLNGKIYFGELTFTPGNGLAKFFPNKYDLVLGQYLEIY